MFKKADSDIIRHDDLVEEGAIRDYLLVELQDLVKYLPVVKTAIAELKKEANSISMSLKGFNIPDLKLDGLKKMNEEMKKANDLSLLHEKLKRAEAQTEKEIENKRRAKAQADKAEVELSKKKVDGIKKEKDAYAQLSAELTKLKREAKNLGAEMLALEKAGKKNTSEYKAIAAQYIVAKNSAAALDKQLKALDHSVGDNQRNVGNYKESIKDVAREIGLFGGTTGRVISFLQIWTQSLRTASAATEENIVATKAAEAATGRWSKAFNILKQSIKSVGLFALIGLLGSIAASFKTTERGIVQFEAIMNSAGDIIKIFIGRLGQFGSALIDYFPAVFKDISNGLFNLKQEFKEFFGLDAEAKRSTDNTKAAVDKMTNAFVGMGGAIKKTINLEFELAELRRKNRRDNLEDIAIIRKYASEVEKLNQKADDQTLSFEEREKAADSALQALQKSSEAEIRIKRRAVIEAQKELDTRKLQNEDTLDAQEKLAEALNQLDDAETKRDVLKLQGEQRQRTIRIKQLQNQIQLIEQTFDKEKELRDKDIADQQNSFAERKRLADELDALSKEKFEKEIARITTQTGVLIDANELMQISDEEALAAKIKSFKLGDKAEDLLLKSITNRKAEIKGIVEQNKALNKDILADLKKQLEVEQQIKNEKVRTIEIQLAQELKLAEDNLKKQKEILERTNNLRKQKLKDDAEFEKQKIRDDKTKSEELKAKEILLIDEKLKNDLLENENNYLNGLKSIHKKQREEIFRSVNQITDGIAEGLQKRSELQQEADQRDIDFHTRMLDVQARLAAEGKDNVLAEELAAADRAQARKIENEKRAQKQQENIALAKVFTETLQQALEKNEPFAKAFFEALAATGVTKEVFAKLFAGGFAEGVENLQGKGTSKSDSNIALLSKGESVTTAEGTAETPGLVTKINQKGYEGAVEWAFENIYKPQFESANVSSTQVTGAGDNGMGKLAHAFTRKIDELKQTIESKPTSHTNLNGLGEWTDTIIHRGMKTVIHHMKQSKRPSLRRNG